MYSQVIRDFILEKNRVYELESQIQDQGINEHNRQIQTDIEIQNYCTKIKLVSFIRLFISVLQLEDALTRRNAEIDQGEENNRQLLSLLEKYDNKLDELQEDNEFKDMKLFEYER